MRAYLMQIKMTLRIMLRNRAALFFGYVLPLAFFFLFARIFRAEQGGAEIILSRVLTVAVLGSGFFGAALYAVMNREANILRRFKVAPISPAPILVASLVASLANFLPMALLTVYLANRVYGMPLPSQPVSLLIFVSLGLLAFCSIGNIIAAVVNSMQEAQIITQIFYLPMLMLGGAAIPLSVMPEWLQIAAQFLPSTYYNTGVQALLGTRETLLDNLAPAAALALTVAVGMLLAMKLFRWEKEEKLPSSAKLWLAAVLGPFLAMGLYQAWAKENIVKARVLDREAARNRSWLIRDVRVFVGDGAVIERGSVLIRNGRIAEVYAGSAPDATALRAAQLDGAGKTLLPGLIDVHAHLGSPGAPSPQAYADVEQNIRQALGAYLFSGVTAVKSAGDGLDSMLKVRAEIASAEHLGAELFTVGPLFTAPGGHGTEYFDQLPAEFRGLILAQTVRTPQTPEQARQQVAELAARGVDGIKVVLEAGGGSRTFPRMDVAVLRAIVEAAHQARLPVVCHTGTARDVADALEAGVDGIEHGSASELLAPDLFVRMKGRGVFYDPTLAVVESMRAFLAGTPEPLERTLVEQVGPRELLRQARASLRRVGGEPYVFDLEIAKQNLAAAFQTGAPLVAGSDSGNPLLVHGPAIHRELQLWVSAGVPPAAALQGATSNAARLLGAGHRLGAVKPGLEANLLLVDGNPLGDISATERISAVFFKGERVNRGELLPRGK